MKDQLDRIEGKLDSLQKDLYAHISVTNGRVSKLEVYQRGFLSLSAALLTAGAAIIARYFKI